MTRTLPHTLSRARLATFRDCRRRFQLRYLERLPWPEAPAEAALTRAGENGRRFHQRLERHFLGLETGEIASGADDDNKVEAWWQSFRRHAPHLPDGRRLVEMPLTVPLGDHLLVGRYDLLVIGERGAHIYDWKTGRPPDRKTLRDDWQTRLYLALLYEGQEALHHGRYTPEQIALTYWYATAPDAAQTFVYDAAWHAVNWADINDEIAALDAQLALPGQWPLTDDLTQCRVCPYQVVCGRQAAGRGPLLPPPENDLSDALPDYPDQAPHFPG